MIKQFVAKVLNKEELSPEIFKVRFFAPPVASQAKPGQFVHLKCGEHHDFILRRPFSVHRLIGDDSFEILFKVVGEGTKWLANLKPRENIDLLGPLGNGFDIDTTFEKALIVAGGMGIAPLFFLISKLAEDKTKIHTAIGAATKSRLLDYMDLKRTTRKIYVTTEDGSQGNQGLITELLPSIILESQPAVIFACGPNGMLKKISILAKKYKLPCQVSLETQMACGVGACLGCVVETVNGYKRVCRDGPVFNASEICW